MFRYLLLLSSVIFFEAAPVANPVLQEPAAPPAQAAPAAPSSTVKNPVRPTADSQAKAKKMYTFDCEMCHAARAKDDDVWNLVIYIRGLAKAGGNVSASH